VASPIPDYLCDPRLSKVGVLQIRKYLQSTGKVSEDINLISTKFALISLAEKYAVPLEEFLEVAVGPAEALPTTDALGSTIPEALPATPQHLVVETEIQTLPTNGTLSSIKARETKQRNDAKAAEVAAAQQLDAQAKTIRAMAGDKAKGVEAARQKKADMEKAAKERLEGAMTSLKKLKGIGNTSDLLDLDVKVLEEAIATAKGFKVPEEALAKYAELAKTATSEQTKARCLSACTALAGIAPLELDTKGLRQAMADATAAGVSEEQQADFKVSLLRAEAEQARKNILDVVEAISDPASALQVNVAQLRTFLETAEVKAAGDAYEKLKAQLDVTETVQGHLKGLEELAMPPFQPYILKVPAVKLHFAIDEAKACGLIPDDVLAKYVSRMEDATEAQSLLKKAEELRAAIKEAQAKGEEAQDELAELKTQLDATTLALQMHEEKEVAEAAPQKVEKIKDLDGDGVIDAEEVAAQLAAAPAAAAPAPTAPAAAAPSEAS